MSQPKVRGCPSLRDTPSDQHVIRDNSGRRWWGERSLQVVRQGSLVGQVQQGDGPHAHVCAAEALLAQKRLVSVACVWRVRAPHPHQVGRGTAGNHGNAPSRAEAPCPPFAQVSRNSGSRVLSASQADGTTDVACRPSGLRRWGAGPGRTAGHLARPSLSVSRLKAMRKPKDALHVPSPPSRPG